MHFKQAGCRRAPYDCPASTGKQYRRPLVFHLLEHPLFVLQFLHGLVLVTSTKPQFYASTMEIYFFFPIIAPDAELRECLTGTTQGFERAKAGAELLAELPGSVVIPLA